MSDYESSFQHHNWLYTPHQLESCRSRANREAREFLRTTAEAAVAAATVEEGGDGRGKAAAGADNGGDGGGGGGGGGADNTGKKADEGGGGGKRTPPVRWYASGYAERLERGEEDKEDKDAAATASAADDDGKTDPNPPLTPDEEALLVQFYSGKIPDLIGPAALLPRLRRDIKVGATASLLFRRFYLSNSVMLHDPKAVMVASAFLGSKVEDATVDVRYLEDATKLMKAPVVQKEIVQAEIALIAGVNFELLCFHPYKTVLAYTEDLRTYLKTERGRALATFPGSKEEEGRPVVGEDLRPIHDEARRIVDDACVSDVPLLASPGQVGLAAMVVADEELQRRQEEEREQRQNGKEENGKEGENNDQQQPRPQPTVPKIDLLGYVRSRFDDRGAEEHAALRQRMEVLCSMLRGLREGKYGCGNHGIDMEKLKAVHKKLKKCRAWGSADDGGDGKKKKKKKKKRKAAEDSGDKEAKLAKTTG